MADLRRSAIIIGLSHHARRDAGRLCPLTAESWHLSPMGSIVVLAAGRSPLSATAVWLATILDHVSIPVEPCPSWEAFPRTAGRASRGTPRPVMKQNRGEPYSGSLAPP